jgi:hypothetical protein
MRGNKGVSIAIIGATEAFLALVFSLWFTELRLNGFGKVKTRFLGGIYVVSNSYTASLFYLNHLCKCMSPSLSPYTYYQFLGTVATLSFYCTITTHNTTKDK